MKDRKNTNKKSRRAGIIIILAILFILISAIVVSLHMKAEREEAARIEEYENRPVVNVLDYVDPLCAVKGYDGTAYIDQYDIVYSLPEDITEILRTSKNYSEEEDYSGVQELWEQVRRDVTYNFDPKPSKEGTLSNGDSITVTATLPGHNLEKIQEALRIKIRGLDDTRTFEVSGLPSRYENVSSLSDASGELISEAKQLLMDKASEEKKIFTDGSYGEYIFDGAYLCKPKANISTSPDALLLVSHISQDEGTEYASIHTFVLYVLPFDCDTQKKDLENIGQYDSGVLVKYESFDYHTPKQVRRSFKKGIYFSANTEYELEKIEE